MKFYQDDGLNSGLYVACCHNGAFILIDEKEGYGNYELMTPVIADHSHRFSFPSAVKHFSRIIQYICIEIMF